MLILPGFKVQGVGGNLLDLSVTAKYYIFSNLAVGARVGYMSFSLDADVESDKETIVAEVDLKSTQFAGVIGFSF